MVTKPLVRDLLPPMNGLFSNMPQTIWGSEMDPSILDVELWNAIGGLPAGRLMRFYYDEQTKTMDVASLAAVVWQRYNRNWKRIWDALLIEYDITLTSTLKSTREVNRETDRVETRNLLDELLETRDLLKATEHDTTRNAEILRELNRAIERLENDLETRNLANSDTGTVNKAGSGTETGDLTTTVTHNTTDLETRNLSGTEGGNESHNKTTTDNGTVSTTTDRSVYGVGQSGARPESRDVVAESRDLDGTDNTTHTRNLTTSDTGTVNNKKSGTDTTVEDRDLASSTSELETRNLAGTDTGTVTNAITGEETASETDSETTTDSTTQTGEETDTGTVSNNNSHSGTIGTDEDENLVETFESEGSSPLRTYQALITEEIEGRHGEGWNFTLLVIENVKDAIAIPIWPRKRYYEHGL